LRHAFIVYPVLAGVGRFVETFKDFPPVQLADSFTPSAALEKLHEAGSGD
jgi:hypothetical protein